MDLIGDRIIGGETSWGIEHKTSLDQHIWNGIHCFLVSDLILIVNPWMRGIDIISIKCFIFQKLKNSANYSYEIDK